MTEIDQLLREITDDHPGLRCERRDQMTVAPVRTPDGAPLIEALSAAIEQVTGRPLTMWLAPEPMTTSMSTESTASSSAWPMVQARSS